MSKNDNYQKISELLEGDFLESVLKRGRSFDDEGSDVYFYVDITDFDEFDFNDDELMRLIDCLQQREIRVFDRHGNEYFDSQRMSSYNNDYDNGYFGDDLGSKKR